MDGGSDPERAALAEAVAAYAEGLHRSDPARLAELFLPEAHLYAEEGGAVLDLPLAAWLERVRARPDFHAAGIPAPWEILALDIGAPGTAFAKVATTVPPARYIDYLSFLRIGGRWRIIAKVYRKLG